MYLNKFSSGTILAMLALSGILLLVPIVAPVHAQNGSSPTVGITFGNPILGGSGTWVELTVTNPSSNSFALTAFTITAPNGWTITSCDWGDDYIENCAAGSTSATFFFTSGSSITPLPPGGQAQPEVYVTSATGVYPFSGTFGMTVQDQSGSNFYNGNTFNIQAIDPTSAVVVTVTPGGSNSATSYTAGSAPYSVSAKVTCTVSANCPAGTESGISIGWSQTGYNPASTGFSFSPTSGTTSSGTTSTTFQPTNIATDNPSPSSPTTLWAFAGPSFSEETIEGAAGSAISTNPGNPFTVGFLLSAAAFPSIDWLPFGTGSASGTSTNMVAGNPFKGAVLCVATQQSCTGASPANTAVAVGVTDKWANPIAFGAGGVTFVGAQAIAVQTASGAVFDTATLPSTITCGVTAGFACPVAGLSVNEPFNYYQGAPYGTAGILTATITGTYGGSTFSVSGSSGTIETSTFATTGAFETTGHSALGATMVTAGKTLTVEYALNIAQSNVPVTILICSHASCGSSSGYSGSLSGTSLVTNSTGIVSTTLTVDTKSPHVAYLNATVLAPINGAPKNHLAVIDSLAITTKAGSAAKFTVVVGPTATLTPSPITTSIPSATVFVNVVTSDAFGNGVTNVGAQQIQVNLIATPNTITVTSAYIPTNCFETNGTSGVGCSVGTNSFGPIAWTLPATGSATISATGVLNGISTTSSTVTIAIVSKSPTISVFSPKPLSGVIYSNSVNVQFRGWANASTGYNGAATMSSLGWKIGAGTWQTTGIAGVNAQWSVIATLPVGLSTVTFNATDSKSNTVVSSTYSVLVDTTAPTVTDTTTAGAVLNAGQLFQATAVDSGGDLNATSVGVTYNGTSLASSAIIVSGTNNPGSSVTYTITAALPAGHWSIVVSAKDLAGNSGSSAAELVSVVVPTTSSFTVLGSPAQTSFNGNPDSIAIVYQNNLPTSQSATITATVLNAAGQQVNVGTANIINLSAGQSSTFYLSFLGLTPGAHYTVHIFVLDNGVVTSTLTTVSITA